MRYEWIASEHHRLHTVEAWPDSPYKAATLRAIHSALGSLLKDTGRRGNFAPCEVCLSRKKAAGLIRFPELGQDANKRSERAA